MPSMTLLGAGARAAASVAAGTWDPANKNAVITLYNGNLTASAGGSPGNWYGVRSTTSHSSGKYIFGISVSADHFSIQAGLGIGTSAYTFGDAGASPAAYVYYTGDGNLYSNGSSLGGGGTAFPASGAQEELIAVDLDNHKIWLYNPENGKWNNDVIGNQNPVGAVGGITIASGTYFVVGEMQLSSGPNFTLDPTPASPPSGFTAWG